MTKIVLFNGPPGAGKDTAAAAVMDHFHHHQLVQCDLTRFSLPLKQAVHAFVGLPCDQHGNGPLEHMKDYKSDWLYGESYRNTQISMSEKWAKEFFDVEIFGKLLARNIKNMIHDTRLHLVVVPDCGFADELPPLIEEFSARHILLVRIRRPGHDFSNDSRSYVTIPGIHTITVDNDTADVGNFRLKAQAKVAAWLSSSPEYAEKERLLKERVAARMGYGK